MTNPILLRIIVLIGYLLAMVIVSRAMLFVNMSSAVDNIGPEHRIEIELNELSAHQITLSDTWLKVAAATDEQSIYLVMDKNNDKVTLIPLNIVILSVILDPLFLFYFILSTSTVLLLFRLSSKVNENNHTITRLSSSLRAFFKHVGQGADKLNWDTQLDSEAITKLQDELKKTASKLTQLEHLSTCQNHQDKLTLLVDRHAFLKHLTRKLLFAERSSQRCALLFIDLDGFKQVNDSFGHSYGDEVLVNVAKRLLQVSVKHDLTEVVESGSNNMDYNVCRLGGDEFSMFIDNIDSSEECVLLAQDVLFELERDFEIGNKIIKISASVGIAIYPDSAATPQSLLQMADVAMYRAKTDGRGIFKIYSPEMSSKLRRYHYLVEEMRLALISNNFTLSFQPIVHVQDCTIDYFEALVRWQHPIEGAIAPSEFIPIAEETNIILDLGDWIMFEACSQMSIWYRAGMKKIKMSVNVSGIQLKHRKLYKWVKDILDRTQLPPTSLMIEITESTLIQASESVISEIQKCREIGIVVAIDDFGTGYSSLSTLADLPVDVIKIDKQFISSAHDSIKYFKILQSIAELGKDLGLKLVAEGVEQSEQFELVKQLGISCVQGYLVSQPQTSTRVNNKVLKSNVNHIALTGTSVWLPESETKSSARI